MGGSGDVTFVAVAKFNNSLSLSPSAAQDWVFDPHTNYFDGCKLDDGKTWIDLGEFPNRNACFQACKKDSSCQAATWHDFTMGNMANRCIGRVDGFFRDSYSNGAYSSRLASTQQTDACTGASDLLLAGVFLTPATHIFAI